MQFASHEGYGLADLLVSLHFFEKLAKAIGGLRLMEGVGSPRDPGRPRRHLQGIPLDAFRFPKVLCSFQDRKVDIQGFPGIPKIW